MSWGPSHQQRPGGGANRKAWAVAGVIIYFALGQLSNALSGLFALIIAGLVIWRVGRWTRRDGVQLFRDARTVVVHSLRLDTHTHTRARARAASGAGGVHLGHDQNGVLRRSRAEHAVLVIGPPRSGKTSRVIIPTVLSHEGPVVSTSTKPDVLHATSLARSRFGRVWQFDPTGTAPAVAGVQTLRWSPVTGSDDWDGALLTARAMVEGAEVGTGTTDGTHWARRAQALLAAMLHGAAAGGESMRTVVHWVATHELEAAGKLLTRPAAAPLAASTLEGLRNTEVRERSAIFSAASDALEAYTSQVALDVTEEPNFYAGRFVRSADTIFIHAPGERQRLAAPLVCGLLAEIRRATYQAHAAGVLGGRVLFALDEVANIAPLPEIPEIASEGGGQGLLLLAALQDLSQARARWRTAADGFLTLFGTKLILPGVVDQRTLETISTALGEYDRQVVAQTRTRNQDYRTQRGYTVSTQRQRVLSPGEVATIPEGRALYLDGVRWGLVTLTTPTA